MKTWMTMLAAAATLATLQGCCKGVDSSCPATYHDLPAAQQKGGGSCKCASGRTGGAVWGSDIYTTDSAICAAAIHTGAIPASGGEVKFKDAAGCPSYKGMSRDGVASSDWGSYETSFYFPGHGDGKCTVAAATDACPQRFRDIPGVSASTEISCTCEAGRATGSVWGSDIYTQDSSICAAAVHAGAITSSGGSVKAKAAAGCKSYKGSARNGVSTSNWGPYDSSFYFPSKGNGTCL